MTRSRPLLPLALAGLLGGVAGGAIVDVAQDDDVPRAPVGRPTTAAVPAPPSAGALYRSSAGAIVTVSATVTGTRRSPSGQLLRTVRRATGSGFVLTADGLLLTSRHVVRGASRFVVRVGSGPRRIARLVGEDPATDVALLALPAGGRALPVLRLADSDRVRVGDPVVAIGNPFGLAGTLTTGVVSAVGRRIASPDGTPLRGVLQTDAALNPGSSGSPLLDGRGRVIGMNAQIEVAPGGRSNTGVGFAVPANTLARVVRRLRAP